MGKLIGNILLDTLVNSCDTLVNSWATALLYIHLH